jgi:hypothetical protein
MKSSTKQSPTSSGSRKSIPKVWFNHFPSSELFCLYWIESQVLYTSQPVKYLKPSWGILLDPIILKSRASVFYVTNKWRRHTLENKMRRVVPRTVVTIYIFSCCTGFIINIITPALIVYTEKLTWYFKKVLHEVKSASSDLHNFSLIFMNKVLYVSSSVFASK